MTEIAVLVPVLGRPERVDPLIRSLMDSLVTVGATPYFVATRGDERELDALCDAGVPHWILDRRRPGDYARKINHAARETVEPWVFLGADDLRFHSGWAEEALRMADKFRSRVIGTNDLGNPAVISGKHSTHSLVARSYIEEHGTIDAPGDVLHEGYDHQFVDNEFVETAQYRGEWTFASRAVVEHLHPNWGKAPEDRTYSLALRSTKEDRRLFRARRRKWSGGTRRVRARA